MKALFDRCILALTRPRTIRACRPDPGCRRTSPSTTCPCPQGDAASVLGWRGATTEQRRAMILDTQRYLNNPRSQAWLRRTN
jgi:hypothetical protein